MDSNSTENQINKTLNSWDNLSTPAVNPYLFEKIKGWKDKLVNKYLSWDLYIG